MSSHDRHTARNVALVGGAVLVAWLLRRGKGGRLGRGGGSGGEMGPNTAIRTPSVPCRVWVRADRLELDGAPADLPTVVTRCREAGHADVRATGDAITRSITTVLRALDAAGVVVNAPPDLARLVARSPEARR